MDTIAIVVLITIVGIAVGIAAVILDALGFFEELSRWYRNDGKRMSRRSTQVSLTSTTCVARCSCRLDLEVALTR